MLTVVIDPGHGGIERIGGSSPNNSTGPLGTLEKNVTLSVAIAAKAFFPSDVEVILTREIDENLGLQTRTRVAQNFRADAFISIHLNGWHSPNVQGTETFHYPNANVHSQRLSKLVQSEVLKVTGLRNRGVKSGKLSVINPRNHLDQTAACLVELSFLTDPDEEIRLFSQNYINRLGHALYQASVSFLRQKYSSLSNVETSISQGVRSLRKLELDVPDGEDASSLERPKARVQPNSEVQSSGDDLTEIPGIGKVRRHKLSELNVLDFKNLSELSPEEVDSCSEVLRVSCEVINDWQRVARAKLN